MSNNKYNILKSDQELLSPEAYQILRKKGTERPFTGEYDHFFEDGLYHCAGCGQALFTSSAKFDSGCGWPAFDREIEKGSVAYEKDHAFGMSRTEILCNNCGGHLGHVFNDGPTETGERFCVNSLSLKFDKGA
jgi:peptide-methionine (R)-S-oxide reductase